MSTWQNWNASSCTCMHLFKIAKYNFWPCNNNLKCLWLASCPLFSEAVAPSCESHWKGWCNTNKTSLGEGERREEKERKSRRDKGRARCMVLGSVRRWNTLLNYFHRESAFPDLGTVGFCSHWWQVVTWRFTLLLTPMWSNPMRHATRHSTWLFILAVPLVRGS